MYLLVSIKKQNSNDDDKNKSRIKMGNKNGLDTDIIVLYALGGPPYPVIAV